MKDLDYLSKKEMYSLLVHLQRGTKYPAARQVYKHTLKFLDDKCPGCNALNEKSRLVRVFKETPDLDIVTYICSECGTVYRKYEDKREIIKSNLMEIV